MDIVIKETQVIWENMENEIIIISLNNGHYYNAQGTGMNIWLCIAAQMSRQNMTQLFLNQYDLPQHRVENDIQQFIDFLILEELVVETQTLISASPSLSPWPQEYAEPTLTKFTDMQELLLIDPIHEVDEHGWPNRYPLPEETV
jgi:hypothetical protein